MKSRLLYFFHIYYIIFKTLIDYFSHSCELFFYKFFSIRPIDDQIIHFFLLFNLWKAKYSIFQNRKTLKMDDSLNFFEIETHLSFVFYF